VLFAVAELLVAFDRGVVPLSNTPLRGETLDTTMKYGPKKLETSSYRMRQNAFPYLDPC